MPSLFKVVGPRQNNQTKFSHAEFHFFKTVANSTKLHNVYMYVKTATKSPFPFATLRLHDVKKLWDIQF